MCNVYKRHFDKKRSVMTEYVMLQRSTEKIPGRDPQQNPKYNGHPFASNG